MAYKSKKKWINWVLIAAGIAGIGYVAYSIFAPVKTFIDGIFKKK